MAGPHKPAWLEEQENDEFQRRCQQYGGWTSIWNANPADIYEVASTEEDLDEAIENLKRK